MYIQIRDIDSNNATHCIHNALIDAGVTQASVIAYNGEIHVDIWQKLRNTDMRNVLDNLGFLGIHPHTIAN